MIRALANPHAGSTASAADVDATDASAKCTFFDDFLGDLLVDEWTAITGSDPQAVAVAIVAGVVNGTAAMTSGDSNPGVTAADAAGVTLGRNWLASQGGLVFEARVQLDAITTVYAFVGFTNTIALERPIESNGTTGLTATAADAVGWLFDTTGTDPDNWMTAGVKATVATARTKGTAPTAATYDLLRVEISTAGTASFYQNGNLIATVANSVTVSVNLTPVLIVMERAVAGTRKLTADYVYVQQNR
jgi:hypothetical protein